MRILSEQSIVNVNFTRTNLNFSRAELYECEIYELSFANVNFNRAEHFKCEFMRAELCVYEFYES